MRSRALKYTALGLLTAMVLSFIFMVIDVVVEAISIG